MKSEHEKLKEICFKIWYETEDINENEEWFYQYADFWVDNAWCYINPREIIFNPKFLDKFFDYLKDKKWFWNPTTVWHELVFNLNDPASYLYNLIK